MTGPQNPQTGRVNVSMYWNVGHSASLPLADSHYGLSDMASSAVDNFYSCTFYRAPLTNISVPGSDQSGNSSSAEFNLDTSRYFLLLASGLAVLTKSLSWVQSDFCIWFYDYVANLSQAQLIHPPAG